MRCKLSEPDFEKAYELIAAGIDRAGPGNERMFLGKLCLVLAGQLGDLGMLKEAIGIAETDG